MQAIGAANATLCRINQRLFTSRWLTMSKAKAAARAVSTPTSVPTPRVVAEPDARKSIADSASAVDDSLALAIAPMRARLPFNPSSGEVHRRECGAPWRVEVEQKIAAANAKAREEQLEKQRWGLAKQVQDGLVHNFGINYGITELATIVKEGVALKREPPGRDLTPTEVAYVQFLAAAEKYDLKQLAVLLDKFPKGREGGKKSGKSSAET